MEGSRCSPLPISNTFVHCEFVAPTCFIWNDNTNSSSVVTDMTARAKAAATQVLPPTYTGGGDGGGGGGVRSKVAGDCVASWYGLAGGRADGWAGGG